MPGRVWNEDHFELLDQLGRGSMGLVYKAREKFSGRKVALKIVSKAEVRKGNMYEPLRREIELQCQLVHPGICRLFGYFHTKHKVFLVQ
jgi:serine/threonine protein kinase